MKKKSSSKILIWVVVAVIIMGGGGAFYYYNFYLQKIGVPVYRAVPKNASLIFDFNNIHQSIGKLKQATYREEIQKTELVSKMLNTVFSLDSAFANEAELLELLQQRKMLASLHLTKSGEYDYLFILDLGKTGKVKLEKIFSRMNIPFEKREFEQTEVLEIKNSLALTCAYKRGLLLASKTAFLVEDALMQLKDKNSILQDASFIKVKNLSAKNPDCTVYVNYQHLPLLASVYAEQSCQPALEKLKETAQWSCVDLVINEQHILLNGYTAVDKSSFLSSFSPSSPADNELIHILPDNISVMFYHSSENFPLPANAEPREQDHFIPWLGNEWAYVIAEPFDTNIAALSFAVVNMKDAALAGEKLAEISEQKGDTAALIEIYKDFPIRKLEDENSFGILFGKLFSPIRHPYYTFIDNFAVFGNSLNELRNFIDKFYNQQTLSKDYNYLAFSENIGSNANFFFYFNFSKALQVLNAFAPEQIVADLKNNFQYYQKFSPAAIQFSAHKDLFYTTGCISYNAGVSRQKGNLWKLQLDTVFEMCPQIVVNHNTKDMEIMVQDLNHNLYLVSKGGQILWQKNTGEKILSGISQLDFFKNGKLQYLFNTKSKVWLVDRNGEEVENLNLKINSPATAGILLVDFDNKKNPRFFIPCENGNIYGYELSGKPLPGWNPKSNTGIISRPLQYFISDKKDYLFAVNDAGTVYLFNRKGEQKAKAELKTQFRNKFYFSENPGLLISADTSGKVYRLDFEGKFSVKEIVNHPWASHPLFASGDIAGDSSAEWCFADGNKLFVFKNDSAALFDYEFSSNITLPLFFIRGEEDEKSKLGVVADSASRLFLFKGDGTLSESFPVNGSTAFDIIDLFKDGGKILVGGNKDGYLFAFRIE